VIPTAATDSAAYFRVAVERIMSRDRHEMIVAARNAAYYIMRHRDGLSYKWIGRRMGRDHSTVMHGIRGAEAMIATNSHFAGFIEAQLAGDVWEPVKVKPKPEPVPAHLIPPQPEPAVYEPVTIGRKRFWVDQNGFDREDRDLTRNVVRGSRKLAEAILAARLAA
jgi:hypothetical protein